ncbi:hypothetical protein H5T56_03740, partial [Candidatus Bipolaricaulota bacterium]|nr:hypothetical protein [Candidatus Bipolaricaulota bacterium]
MGQSLAALWQPTPFRVDFAWEGEVLVSLGDGTTSALYLKSWTGRIDLKGPASIVQEKERTRLVYRTSDGRRAHLELRPVEEGAVQVRFFVEGKQRWERLGMVLEVTPDEGFYGLTERPIQGIFQ